MIAQQQVFGSMDVACPLQSTPPRSGALAELACRVGSELASWTDACSRPHAWFWLADLIGSLTREPEFYEPDPFSAESPFVHDSWPRGL